MTREHLKHRMGRLIEIQSAQALPPSLKLRVGDVLLFAASGGHINSGEEIVEILGAFIPGSILDTGAILSPMGAPSAVLVFARRSGRATIDVGTGGPWHASQTTTLEITVDS